MNEPEIQIGRLMVGMAHEPYMIAEIGINHNGDIDLALQMMAAAKDSGADAVKFQKRDVCTVYSEEELARPRESPFGKTNGDLKHGLEFGDPEYRRIARSAEELGIDWFCSVWDEKSVEFLQRIIPGPVAYKIPSACVTDIDLIWECRYTGKPMILSTGMSTMEEVSAAIEAMGFGLIMACTAAYPCRLEDLNLLKVDSLVSMFGDSFPIGWSGHEVGIATSVVTIGMGACAVERHFTLDRSMWGSDQASSVEPQGFRRLAKECRDVWHALGKGSISREECEMEAWKKLRRKK